MKFAKQLRENAHAEWDTAYIDYKLLKKVLKQLASPQAAAVFCAQLEQQINKVAAFMREQQECLADGIEPLFLRSRSVTDGGSSGGDPSTALAHFYEPDACQEVVDNIQKFRSYTELNQEALRKIIKKFDKRFQLSFTEEVYPAAAPAMPCTEKEVVAWLLKPAAQCLRLVRCMDSSQEVARPIQQFNFWATELAIGCDLLRTRFDDDDVEDQSDAHRIASLRVRLGAMGPTSIRMCIKNTFIHSIDSGDGSGSREERSPQGEQAEGPGREDSGPPLLSLVRRKSLPPDFTPQAAPLPSASPCSAGCSDVANRSTSTVEALSNAEVYDEEEEEESSWGNTPMVVLEHMMCEELQIAPPPREWRQGWEEEEEEEAEDDDHYPFYDGEAWPPASTPSSRYGGAHISPTSASNRGQQRAQRASAGSSAGGGWWRGYDGGAATGRGSGGGRRGGGGGWRSGAADASLSVGNYSGSHAWDGNEYNHSRHSSQWRDRDSPGAVGPRSGAAGALSVGPEDGSCQAHGGEGHGARWWTESPGECPLCGFPVSMLPHPPFRFRAEPNSSGRYRLVDGQYLALDVLSTWRFEALGRQLTIKDINALDAYIKRCKLGPWRLGEAMALLSDGSSESHNKLEALRRSARRKLEDLKRIQQRRKQLAAASGPGVAVR
mmetsp:Transcript_75799/g.180052  ORF Transcript_75799/g.180052 Transcript_75799/m.180052 type:complete len:663 (-) Transcript_75799:111-2099(-)